MSADYAAATITWGVGGTITLLELFKKKLDICNNWQDEFLSLYLQMAGEASEAYCDNVLAEQEVTESHPGTFSPVSLRYYPVSTLDSVTVDGDDKTTDYETFKSEGIDYVTVNRTSANYPDGFKQFNITYTAGYEPIPADLGAAIVRAAVSYESGIGATGEVKKESVVGVGSIEYSTSADDGQSVGMLSASVTGVLDKYRRQYV